MGRIIAKGTVEVCNMRIGTLTQFAFTLLMNKNPALVARKGGNKWQKTSLTRIELAVQRLGKPFQTRIHRLSGNVHLV